MSHLTLTHIFVYPVKSLGGISLRSVKTEERGLQHDRRWMLVDKNGMFLTQREHPQMALLQVDIKNDMLEVTHKTKTIPNLQLPIYDFQLPTSNPQPTATSIAVNIWNDIVIARIVSRDADQWFSEVLNMDCHLVFMDNESERLTDSQYTPQQKQVSFADAYPFLIIGQESLNELNRRLKEPLPMNRFRPNFVFSGGEPFIEDTWKDLMIGNLKFRAVKPCARCVVTTVNQDTAVKASEPLETLAKFRKDGNKVNFGINAVGFGAGMLEVGDQVVPLDG
jgi:hypothetical protein